MKKEGRLHVRLNKELVEQAHIYAKNRHTTVSALVEQYLLHLVESDEQQQLSGVEPAEQI